MGWNAQPTRMITFEDVKIPVSNRIGDEGEGFKFAMKGLDGGRINIAACALGAAQSAMNATQSYMAERKAFGRPVIGFQNSRFKLAEIKAEPKLADLALVKQSRLSVVPVSAAEWKLICKMGGYKGWGFGLMAELLAAGMTGGVVSRDVKPLKAPEGPPHDLGQYYLLMDPDASGAFFDRLAKVAEGVAIDGLNILPLARGSGSINRMNNALFWQSGHAKVVRAGDWKLQVNGRLKKEWLFDLANDPTEQVNFMTMLRLSRD